MERQPMTKSVFTDAYQVLLAVIVEARRQAGKSQVDLAARLGRPQPFVSYIERGERRLDVIEFVAIARALDRDPNDLFAALLTRLPDEIEI
jgi:transcriptional regulator with XRE-family HTH domain